MAVKSKVAKLTQRLREQQGFDASYVSSDGYARVKCSQCEALVINGMATHETGCQNTPRDDDDD